MRILLCFMSESALFIFCSKGFGVSAFIFRSLIHFKFILCIVLGSVVFSLFSHVAVQFSQDHFLKRLSFVHCMFLPSFSYKLPVGMWVITGLSILFHWCVFLHFANTILSWLRFHCTIVWIRDPDASSSFLLSQHCFYSGSFVFLWKSKKKYFFP